MSGHSKWSTDQAPEGRQRRQARRRLHQGRAARSRVAAAPGRRRPRRATTGSGSRSRRPARSTCRPTTSSATIDKATGGGEAEQFEEIVYEGYGPGGVAVLVEAATDNRNRTAAEVRSIFAKTGGQLAGSGAVAWQFEPRGADRGRRATARSTPTRWRWRRSTPAPRTSTPTRTSRSRSTPTPGELEPVRKALEGAGVAGRVGRERDDRQADRRARRGRRRARRSGWSSCSRTSTTSSG